MKTPGRKSSTKSFSEFGMALIFVAIGSLLIHCFVLIIEMYISGTFSGNEEFSSLFYHFFSKKMIPVLISDTLLVSAVYYLFKKTKKTMQILNDNEMKNERMKTMLHTSQVTSGILINQIQGYNAELKKWIFERESNGGKSPEKIIQINRSIEKSLSTISKKFFLDPYVGGSIFGDEPLDHGNSEMLNFSQNLQNSLAEADEK